MHIISSNFFLFNLQKNSPPVHISKVRMKFEIKQTQHQLNKNRQNFKFFHEYCNLYQRKNIQRHLSKTKCEGKQIISILSFIYNNTKIQYRIQIDQIYQITKKQIRKMSAFDVDKLIQKCLKCQLIPQQAISILCHKLKDIFIQQKNVNAVQAPITVVGDVHGQFYDVLQIFKIGGDLPYTSYLFLGDYVDRGAHSIQVITLLCLLKIKYPNQMNMIRGNHQTRAITQNYGFYMECQTKYGNTIVWEYFTDIFDYFPIAATIDNKIFAVHGGLSPLIQSLDQVQGLDRFQQIPHDGPLCDMMWSDPEQGQTGFVISPRGAGYIFGQQVLKKFLHYNNMEHLTRAHQLCTQGYQLLFKQLLSTVWSAPNYIYRMGNMASIMEVNQFCQKSFNVFSQSPQNIARGIAAAMDTKIIKNESQKYFM